MINTRVRRFLDGVVKPGSIRKAGEKLGIAPSSINRQIIALEEDLGSALFERLPRKMRPTAACEALIAFARETATAERRVMEEIDAMKGGLSVQCKIATVPGIACDPLSHALAEHRRAHPPGASRWASPRPRRWPPPSPPTRSTSASPSTCRA